MAEGMARLNQQVVGTDYWDRSDRLASREGALPLGSIDPSQGNQPVRTDEIRGAVEADIIPRLCPGGDQASDAVRPRALAEAEVRQFSTVLLKSSQESVVDGYLADLQTRGLSIEQIYLDLFQPAARHIGELWVADLCSFVDVTLAVGTMQRAMRALGSDFHKNSRSANGSRLALMVPMPGDQHTFGLSMVAEFFRRNGWNVSTNPHTSADELIANISGASFAVAGFSISRDDRLDEAAGLVGRIRRESLNPHLGIMIGGPAVLNCPDLAARVGADAVSRNAIEALAQAEAFAAR